MNDDACRREQILKAADRLLRHYGPHKTTIADVAREAGVGVGTVYLEFPSKDALIEELSRSRYRAVLDAMRARAAAAGRPFSERLSTAFDARLEAFLALADEGVHACDLVHCVSAAVKTAEASFSDGELSLLVDVLRGGVEAGEFDVREPLSVARSVRRAYVSFMPPWLFGKDRGEVRRELAAMHELILSGLLRRSPPQKSRRPDAPSRPRR
jgi:AcrR family transcriptional regulator